ncbi:PAS domain-containing protein [bacterium]|jgi:PAS domain S-box-containing protein|nr:PAS domain-containing protein [bacterium]
MRWVYVLLVFLTLLITSFRVIFHARPSSRWFFSLFGFSTILWTASTYLMIYMETAALLWTRITFVGPVIFIVALNYFVHDYPAPLSMSRWVKWSLLSLGIVQCISVFFPWVVLSVGPYPEIVYGPGFSVYTGLSLLGLGRVFRILIRQQKELIGYERLCARYFIYALIGLVVVPIISNLLLPLCGITDWTWLGICSLMIFPVILSIPVLGYNRVQLISILQEMMYYTFLSIAVGSIYAGTTYMVRLIPGFGKSSSMGLILLVSIGVMLLIPKLQLFFRYVVNLIFFRQHFDYQKTLRELSDRLHSMIHLDGIATTLTSALPVALKVDQVRLLLRVPDGRYVQHGHYLTDGHELSETDAISKQLKKSSNGLEYDAIQLERDFCEGDKKSEMTRLLARMSELGYKLCYPLIISGQLEGILCIGAKRMFVPFNRDDVVLVESIVNHTVLAIQNAHIFHELEENRDTLQALNRFCAQMSTSVSVTKLCDDVSDVLAYFLGLKNTIVYREHYQTREMELVSITGDGLFQNGRWDLEVDDILLHWQASRSSMAPFVYTDDLNHPYRKGLKRVMDMFGASQMLVIPLLVGERVIGCVFGLSKTSIDYIAMSRKQVLGTIAQECAVALNNVRLYDYMTQLKNYHESILHNMGTGVLVCDEQGQIVNCNKLAGGLFGQYPSDLLGRQLSELAVKVPSLSIILETFDTGNKIEEIMLKIDSNSLHYSLMTSTITVSDKRFVIAVFHDINPIKQLQRQVEQVDRLASLGTMAAGVAHEIRNPLVSVKTFSQLIPSRKNDPSFREEFAKIVIPQVERINDMCQSLLDLGRPRKPELGALFLKPVLSKLATITQVEASSANVTLTIYCDEDVQIMADLSQISQVFLNLLMNAYQSMPDEGGEVVIQIDTSNAEFVSIRVSDNGCGMTSDQMDQIFDPFFTLKDQGTGLGLSVVHQILKDHGGTIEAESEEGKGTCFTLRLAVVKKSDLLTLA